MKKPLWIFLGLSLIAAITSYTLSLGILSHYNDRINLRYISLLDKMGVDFMQIEKKISLKLKHTRPLETGLRKLSTDEIQERVSLLEKEIKLDSIPFPLEPNIPRVSDLLAWLSNHPQLNGNKILIELMHYQLVKHPEMNKPKERYLVKVELEFTSETPKAAREFHDALLAQNDFIDPKGEVKWNTLKGKYKVSFYLKDKTIYPELFQEN